jgi:VIT1/CCC1 family predicted Fe2+/Mn2+ transporter
MPVRSRLRLSHHEQHHFDRLGWLRAGVLGANDGLLSVASLIVGVAAADNTREAVTIAGLAALVAGAFSMAVGEFASVSSQRDSELADLDREREELSSQPGAERRELALIYERRGLPPSLAAMVSEHLTAAGALDAHARDELGIDPARLADPRQAASASAAAFTVGGLLPLTMAIVAPSGLRIVLTVGLTLVLLGVLGSVGARLGGANRARAVVRLVVGGALALGLTVAIGAITGAAFG